MIRPKQLARIGVFYLHEAVLDVLCDHHQHDKHGLGAAEINRRAGMHLSVTMNQAVATGCLLELLEQGRVKKVPKKNSKKDDGWRLSEKEYGRRGDDSQI